MTKLSAAARETIKADWRGLTIAGYTRHFFGDQGWAGDVCGCVDNRCVGFHHDGTDVCGCLPVWLDDYARAAAPLLARWLDDGDGEPDASVIRPGPARLAARGIPQSMVNRLASELDPAITKALSRLTPQQAQRLRDLDAERQADPDPAQVAADLAALPEHRVIFDGLASGVVEWRCSCGSSGSGSTPAAAERIADAYTGSPDLSEHPGGAR